MVHIFSLIAYGHLSPCFSISSIINSDPSSTPVTMALPTTTQEVNTLATCLCQAAIANPRATKCFKHSICEPLYSFDFSMASNECHCHRDISMANCMNRWQNYKLK